MTQRPMLDDRELLRATKKQVEALSRDLGAVGNTYGDFSIPPHLGGPQVF